MKRMQLIEENQADDVVQGMNASKGKKKLHYVPIEQIGFVNQNYLINPQMRDSVQRSLQVDNSLVSNTLKSPSSNPKNVKKVAIPRPVNELIDKYEKDKNLSSKISKNMFSFEED